MEDSGRDKVQHFVNVEGSEKRAKAAAKKQKQAEKRQKKLDETPNQKKAKRKRLFIKGAVCLLILLVASFSGFRWYREYNISDEEAKAKALETFLEIRAKGAERDYDSVNTAREEYLRVLEKSKGTQKFYHILSYIEFSATYKTGYDEISLYMEQAKNMIKTTKQEQDYKNIECFVYGVYDGDKYKSICIETEEQYEDQ